MAAAVGNSTVRSALILGGFALLGAGLVSVTHELTRERINQNERRVLLSGLQALLPTAEYDNALLADTVLVSAPKLLGGAGPVTVYRAFLGDRPVAALAAVTAPDGYNGSIKLLVGVYADGVLAGVRVLSHKETPGLGDAIEADRSDWIEAFAGKFLHDPDKTRWTVKKDGGDFDQFTGATITPRAVVKAVRRFLAFFALYGEALLREPRAAGLTEGDVL